MGRLCGLTGDVGRARDVFLGSSLEAFAHKMGELGTEGCLHADDLRAVRKY
jgi:hypothetical protein